MKTISIGFSPCPNDTFIFHALVNGLVSHPGFKFQPLLADVEELNRMAENHTLTITKLSFAHYPTVSSRYQILNSGSALGRGAGPLLVSKKYIGNDLLPTMKVAIPGKKTTANLLLATFFPGIINKEEMLFSEIEDAVLNGDVDAGLLIHEGRFTYKNKGLHLLYDLGNVWETQMNVPLPLGCIVVSRDLSKNDQRIINDLIKKSIEYAYNNPAAGSDYIREHAQEMDAGVIEQHIQLYVNDFSLDLGLEGKRAIEFLLNKGMEKKLLPPCTQPIFID